MSAFGFYRGDQVFVAGDLACGVHAHVDGVAVVVGGLGSEHVVERGHAVCVGRGHGQRLAQIVDPAGAYPTGLVLQGVQGWQEEASALTAPAGAADHQPLGLESGGRGRSEAFEHAVHGGSLRCGGAFVAEFQVSHGRASARMSTASRSGWRRL